ncbi:hypothetical protein I302_107725 [Kwoniella bestiolae CBS 10118]|uniref:Uncharacterized protein n=1 Tax=Kwoniella bestiolae CBS 10118 TaxID=1296100 RepID=A0A1B9FXP8_9TREE|nr:hypothetical protein I302_06536 [Kwoniella bestiolae CBS 10118]OCF23553.1 hypothetical protein I302_06536 [Kwoniella bestiolae CBS 10118]
MSEKQTRNDSTDATCNSLFAGAVSALTGHSESAQGYQKMEELFYEKKHDRSLHDFVITSGGTTLEDKENFLTAQGELDRTTKSKDIPVVRQAYNDCCERIRNKYAVELKEWPSTPSETNAG